MNKFLIAAMLAIPAIATPVLAADPAPAAAPAASAYTTESTDIGTLLDNPATKAILAKHIPEMMESPQIEMARAMTLKQIQGFAPDKVTEEMLAKIDADLKTLK